MVESSSAVTLEVQPIELIYLCFIHQPQDTSISYLHHIVSNEAIVTSSSPNESVDYVSSYACVRIPFSTAHSTLNDVAYVLHQ